MLPAIASTITIRRTFAEYAWLLGLPPSAAQPGSLQYGSSHRINDWMEMSTWRSVDWPAIQPGPDQVPRRDRHTFCTSQLSAESGSFEAEECGIEYSEKAGYSPHPHTGSGCTDISRHLWSCSSP